jgi:hypothetical protein
VKKQATEALPFFIKNSEIILLYRAIKKSSSKIPKPKRSTMLRRWRKGIKKASIRVHSTEGRCAKPKFSRQEQAASYNEEAVFCCICSSMVEHQLPKLVTRVRFPPGAPGNMAPFRGAFSLNDRPFSKLGRQSLIYIAFARVVDYHKTRLSRYKNHLWNYKIIPNIALIFSRNAE